MAKHAKSGLVLFAGLLVGLLLVSGCAPSGGDQSSTGSDFTFVIIVVVFILAYYLLMIRPQRNRQKQQRKQLSELKPGDQVITMGGIYGEIDSMDEESVVLKVESGAKMRVAKSSIAGKRS